MHCGNVLSEFKVEWDAYKDLITQDDPKVSTVNDKEQDIKIIRKAPIFLDLLSCTYGSHGPLHYVPRDNTDIPEEDDDPSLLNTYYVQSGSLLEKLIERLPHEGPIFNNDNAMVYMMIEKAVRGPSVESTIKSYYHEKDGRSAFKALKINHAGETKYRGIIKKIMNLLQNIKCNGRTYPLETHITTHRQAFDNISECSEHITVPVPDQSQGVEYLIDSLACGDNMLQVAIGLVQAKTNEMRRNFEVTSTALCL